MDSYVPDRYKGLLVVRRELCYHTIHLDGEKMVYRRSSGRDVDGWIKYDVSAIVRVLDMDLSDVIEKGLDGLPYLEKLVAEYRMKNG